MKDEIAGGSAAESQLRERLARQFAEELGRAETDYRTLRAPERAAVERLQPRRRMKLRLAVEGIAAVVLLVVGLVVYGQGRTPATPGGSPSVVRGADGIPTEIDGQRVYGVAERSEWQKLNGSFLLSGYALPSTWACAYVATEPPAEADLLDTCRGPGFAAKPNVWGLNSNDVWLAPLGSGAVAGWLGGPAIVVRVHTNDPEAAQCAASDQAQCSAAIVVEAVVWPEVPTQIAGQRVYRQTDQASFPTSGSFLLGGLFSKPDVVPPCAAPIGKSEAEQQLIPYCYILSIDGLDVAPMSNIDEPKDEIVVARVHIHDALAAQCPEGVRSECEDPVVVETVVWRSNPYATTLPTAGASSPARVSTPESPSERDRVCPLRAA